MSLGSMSASMIFGERVPVQLLVTNVHKHPDLIKKSSGAKSEIVASVVLVCSKKIISMYEYSSNPQRNQPKVVLTLKTVVPIPFKTSKPCGDTQSFTCGIKLRSVNLHHPRCFQVPPTETSSLSTASPAKENNMPR